MMKNILIIISYIGLICLLIHTCPELFFPDKVISDIYDPILNVYIMEDNLNYLLGNRDGSFWDIPYFHPYKNTKALNETLIPESLIFGLTRILGADLLQGYNITFLIYTVIGLMGMFALARFLGFSHGYSFISSLFYVNCNYWSGQWSHLNVLAGYCMVPWFFLSMLYYYSSISYARLIIYIMVTSTIIFSNGYYLIFSSILVFTAFIIYILSCSQANRFLAVKHLIFFVICVVSIQLPFLLTYLEIHEIYGFKRPMEELIFYSADIINFFDPSRRNIFPYPILGSTPEATLFPGAILYILLIYAVVVKGKLNGFWENLFQTLFRSRALVLPGLMVLSIIIGYVINGLEELLGFVFFISLFITIYIYFKNKLHYCNPGNKNITSLILVTLGIVSLLICFGPIVKVNGHQLFRTPYYLLYKYVPGFKSFRVPTRIYPVVQLLISLVAVSGLNSMIMKSTRKGKIILMTVFLVLWGLENFFYPLPLATIHRFDLTNKTIKEINADVVVEFPISLRPRESIRLYNSLFHGKKIVNGYAGGYFPSRIETLAQISKNGFSKELISKLKQMGVKLIVVDTSSEFWREASYLAMWKGSLDLVKEIPSENRFIMKYSSLKLKKNGVEKKLMFPKRIEAESLPYYCGRNVKDPQASKQVARFAEPLLDKKGYLTYGPYVNYKPGKYRAIFRLKTNNNNPNKIIADIHVSANYHSVILAEKDLVAIDFIHPLKYQDFVLEFEVTNQKHLEFIVTFVEETSLWVDYIQVEKIK